MGVLLWYGACTAIIYAIYYFSIIVYRRYKWAAVSAKKREQLLEDFERVRKLLQDFSLPAELESKLFRASVADIHQMLFDEPKITCVNLVKYFTKKSINLGLELNLVVQFTYEYALEHAKQRDEELKQYSSPKELPCLFGIPISVKDMIKLKGYDTTLGSGTMCFNPNKDDGLQIKLLLKQGAVPFLKSNLPMLMLINETNNWIVGNGKNPWNKKRSCGGSSGGEGGLVSLGCSPLGIGTDGGGSVRIPALYCGIYGFRPTARRITLEGMASTNEYTPPNIFSGSGPLANNVEDCERLTKALLDKELYEKYIPDYNFVPWKTEEADKIENKKKLKVGVYWNIKYMKPSAANTRALKIAVDKLKAAGHEVIDLSFEKYERIVEYYIK